MKKLKVTLIIVLSLLIISPLVRTEPIIDSIVGTFQAGYNGDNIMAEQASLYNPMGVCADEFGRVYIADTQNNRIRVVDNLNVIDTIAGNGIFGYNGDEKMGTKCSFAFPMGVHVVTADQAKQTVRTYVADTRNNRIRMINENGIMITVAGSGRYGYSGDNGPATKCDLAWPSSVTLDVDGNMYIADTYNHRIRVVYKGGTIAGDGQKLIIPNPKPRHIYTLAGTGKAGYGGDTKLANAANLNTPWDVYPVAGELFISDKGNHIIRKVDVDGVITTVAGIPGIAGYYGDILKATEEKIHTPFGIWADENFVYVSDSMNYRIRKVDHKADAVTTFSGIGEFGFGGDGAPTLNCMLSHPVDIFGDGKGTFYLCDLQNQRIRIIRDATNVGPGP